MPFREHGPQETPPTPSPLGPGQNPFGPQPQIINPPRWDEDDAIELDRELHSDAERKAAMQQYKSPIMSNEREQRRLARQARKAAPKPGKFNLVPPGRNVFPGEGPAGPKPIQPPQGPAQ